MSKIPLFPNLSAILASVLGGCLEFLIPRTWNKSKFLSGTLESGMYFAVVSTSDGFPIDGDAAIIVFRGSGAYHEAAFLFESNLNETTRVFASCWRSTYWKDWKEL